MQKKILKTLTTSLALLSSTSVAYAQDAIGKVRPPAGSTIIVNPSDIYKLFSAIVNILTVVAGLWFFINLLLAGLSYTTGAGDPKKTGDAMKKITDSITGLAIVASAFIIANIASYLLLGPTFSIFNPVIKTISDF